MKSEPMDIGENYGCPYVKAMALNEKSMIITPNTAAAPKGEG